LGWEDSTNSVVEPPIEFIFIWFESTGFFMEIGQVETGTLHIYKLETIFDSHLRDAYSNSIQEISNLLKFEEAFPHAIRAQTSFFCKISSP
jgi:hypothetical protein